MTVDDDDTTDKVLDNLLLLERYGDDKEQGTRMNGLSTFLDASQGGSSKIRQPSDGEQQYQQQQQHTHACVGSRACLPLFAFALGKQRTCYWIRRKNFSSNRSGDFRHAVWKFSPARRRPIRAGFLPIKISQ